MSKHRSIPWLELASNARRSAGDEDLHACSRAHLVAKVDRLRAENVRLSKRVREMREQYRRFVVAARVALAQFDARRRER